MTTYASRLSRSEDGFTLLEIIVVTAIIGVLATIAVANYYAKPREVASDAAVQGALTTVHTAALQANAGKAQGTLTKADVRPAMVGEGIEWDVVSTANYYGFCSLAWTPGGGKYPSASEAMMLESQEGACNRPAPVPEPTVTTTTEPTPTETTTVEQTPTDTTTAEPTPTETTTAEPTPTETATAEPAL